MEKQKIVLSENLVASIQGKEILRRYRAVLSNSCSQGDDFCVVVEQPINGCWHATGGYWYLDTLLEDPSDGIYLDWGQRWSVDSGMLEALAKAAQIIDEQTAA